MQQDADFPIQPVVGTSGAGATRGSSATTHPVSAHPHTATFEADHEESLTAHVHPGEHVLVLKCGTGVSCRAAARLAGEQGQVTGIDDNESLLSQARSTHSPPGSSPTGYGRGNLQDLRLDLERLDAWLSYHPARTSDDWQQTVEHAEELRQTYPLVASDSVDVVIADRMLNKLPDAQRTESLKEMFRVLKRGGRVIVQETTGDEVPAEVVENAPWREDRLFAAFEAAGFYGIELLARDQEPRYVVDGVQFRHITIRAFKGKQGPCLERFQAVIYNGPWKAVVDDDGHTLYRGQRMAVCDKTYNILTQEPYAGDITPIPPAHEVPLSEAGPFQCQTNTVRDPRETRGTPATAADPSLLPLQDCCGPAGCC